MSRLNGTSDRRSATKEKAMLEAKSNSSFLHLAQGSFFLGEVGMRALEDPGVTLCQPQNSAWGQCLRLFPFLWIWISNFLFAKRAACSDEWKITVWSNADLIFFFLPPSSVTAHTSGVCSYKNGFLKRLFSGKEINWKFPSTFPFPCPSPLYSAFFLSSQSPARKVLSEAI